ncbi:hypothetical protein KFK09_023592 [Dendrobium nobile]|uniref:Uncharacterized protein n=1 Tax=Dendrobium nobile TaxID=94219 RepID=A0A8T3ABP6_DENNO|nr:hypothetical protein KFK09_023592 [Dendrobium nobile]
MIRPKPSLPPTLYSHEHRRRNLVSPSPFATAASDLTPATLRIPSIVWRTALAGYLTSSALADDGSLLNFW